MMIGAARRLALGAREILMLNWFSLKLCCGRAYNGRLVPLS